MRLLRWLRPLPAEASRLVEERWFGEEVEGLWKRGGWMGEQLQGLQVEWADGAGGTMIQAPLGSS